VICFDTETTGLPGPWSMPLSRQPEITELFVVSTVGIIEYDGLFKPTGKISEKISKITGIDDALVENAPKFADRAERVRTLFEGTDAVIAHGAAFDTQLVDMEFARLGQPKIRWPRVICTLEQTVHLKGYRLSLSELYEHLFGEKFPHAHRARNDTMALLRVTKALIERDEI